MDMGALLTKSCAPYLAAMKADVEYEIYHTRHHCALAFNVE